MKDRICKIRKRAGLNQDDFAQRLGLTKNYISLIETGNREPSDRTIRDICREFQVNEAWLRTGEGGDDNMFAKLETVNLDDFAKLNNATESDYQLICNYLSLSPDTRLQIQSLFSPKE